MVILPTFIPIFIHMLVYIQEKSVYQVPHARQWMVLLTFQSHFHPRSLVEILVSHVLEVSIYWDEILPLELPNSSKSLLLNVRAGLHYGGEVHR